MAATVVNAVGMGIEGFGLVLAFVGIVRTGRAHGFKFGRPAAEWSKARWRWVERIWRTMFSRPKSVNVVLSPSGIGSAAMFGTGRVDVGFGPLDPDLDTTSAVSELDRRIRHLETRQVNIRSMTDEHLARTDRAVAAVTADVQRADARVDQLKDELPIEGLGTEALGLAIVGVGLIVQFVATILPSLP
jgi:hypothetical protein